MASKKKEIFKEDEFCVINLGDDKTDVFVLASEGMLFLTSDRRLSDKVRFATEVWTWANSNEVVFDAEDVEEGRITLDHIRFVKYGVASKVSVVVDP